MEKKKKGKPDGRGKKTEEFKVGVEDGGKKKVGGGRDGKKDVSDKK